MAAPRVTVPRMAPTVSSGLAVRPANNELPPEADEAPAVASAAVPAEEAPPVTDDVAAVSAPAPPTVSVAAAASSPPGSHAASSLSSSSWRRSGSDVSAAASFRLRTCSWPGSARRVWAVGMAAVGCACAGRVRVSAGWSVSLDCVAIGAVFLEKESVDRRDGDIRHRAGGACTQHDEGTGESAVGAVGRLAEGARRVASCPEVAVTRRTRRPRPVRPGVGALFQAGVMKRGGGFSPGWSRPEAVGGSCLARSLPRCPGSRPTAHRQ